jgi:hypothetical protein
MSHVSESYQRRKYYREDAKYAKEILIPSVNLKNFLAFLATFAPWRFHGVFVFAVFSIPHTS